MDFMKTKFAFSLSALLAAAALGTAVPVHAEDVWLSSLDLSPTQQDFGGPGVDKSVDGRPLSIGGRKFERGLGTHASSTLRVAVDGQAERFAAWVGVDDEIGKQGSVAFQVVGDGKTLWDSGEMRGGDAAREVSVDLKGVQKVVLRVG